MDIVRFGILGVARTAMKRTIPAIRKVSSLCRVEGIASRGENRAQALAGKMGIPLAFGSYEALLESPDIDAVYIPLPNHLHVPWAIRALRAGKHVLCEKPVAVSVEQARELAGEASRHPECRIMEAFMFRHHTQWLEIKERIQDGELGEVRAIQSVFSYYNMDPDNIRNRPDKGGGAMMDVGCYCISLSRWLLGSEPESVCGCMDVDPDFGTDRMFSGVMKFGSCVSSFTCSTQLESCQQVFILGTRGRIEVMAPFNPPPDGPTSILLHRDGQIAERGFECDHYAAQAADFARSILEGTPVPVPLEDAIANLRVHEALMRSAREQYVVRL